MNKNENYIMLDGKKIPLTDEQVKQIRGEMPEKSPFDRVDMGDTYYYINPGLVANICYEGDLPYDRLCYEAGNYCTDKDIMKQHALHMLLNNLLWRYSMTHGGDSVDWDDGSEIKFNIYYDTALDEFGTAEYSVLKYFGVVHFVSEEIAKAAIEEIVKPFIAEHPDFDLTKM